MARTQYCIQPPEALQLPAVGGTKNPNIEQITSLAPDLVIANKEENKQYDVNRLRAAGIPVYVTNAQTVTDAVREMQALHALLDSPANLPDFQEFLTRTKGKTSYSFLYLVWKDPLMVAGEQTYISSLISHVGGNNLANAIDASDRYPTLSEDDLGKLQPDILFLPDEPYRFTNTDQQFYSDLLPNCRVVLVDGKLASWYSLQLLSGLEYFVKLP